MRAFWYLVVVVLAALGFLSLFRVFELLLFSGGLTSYGAGRLTGSVLMAVLMLLAAWKALAKARAA